MAKVKVRKCVYQLWTAVFYSLCLSGLIWQVTQISINFFHFEVMKDINVMTPEETNSSEEMFTICFENSETLIDRELNVLLESKYNNTKYLRSYRRHPSFIMKRAYVFNMTIAERFAITFTPEDLVLYRNEFILGTLYCYQSDTNIRQDYRYVKELVQNVTSIRISVSRRSFFDLRRHQIVGNINTTADGLTVHAKSYSYTMNRLEWPYEDNCFDYHNIGYR